jgi:hypothetical protein
VLPLRVKDLPTSRPARLLLPVWYQEAFTPLVARRPADVLKAASKDLWAIVDVRVFGGSGHDLVDD